MSWEKIAALKELPEGEIKRVVVGGEAICLAHVEGEGVFAISDLCTHEEQSLSEGQLWGCQVECPAHGSLFDVRTGEVSGIPAMVPARRFDARVSDDDMIEVLIID